MLPKLKFNSVVSLSFPENYPFYKTWVLEQHWEGGTSLLTKLKVAINEGFSWGFSKISKGEGCQNGGIKYNEDETPLSIMYISL